MIFLSTPFDTARMLEGLFTGYRGYLTKAFFLREQRLGCVAGLHSTAQRAKGSPPSLWE